MPGWFQVLTFWKLLQSYPEECPWKGHQGFSQEVPLPHDHQSDMWHMTHESWHATCGGRRPFSQYFSSIAFNIFEWIHFEDFEEKDHRLTYWLNVILSNKFVSRTTPATLGLLKMYDLLYANLQWYQVGFDICWYKIKHLKWNVSKLKYLKCMFNLGVYLHINK